MPKKVNSHPVLAAVLMFTLAGPDWGQAAAVSVRAAKPPSAELLNLVADGAAPTRLNPQAYPDAGSLTAARIIGVLCGEVRPEYWAVFVRQNDAASLNPDEVLGARAYELAFPACLYVRPNPKVVVQQGDRAADVYKALTGKTGARKNIEDFFGRTTKSLSALTPGEELQASYVTLPTVLRIESPDLQARMDRLIALAPDLTSPTVRPLPPSSSTARLFTSPGSIASPGAITGEGGLKEPTECDGAPAQTELERERIVTAYRRAFSQLSNGGGMRASVEVLVIDNGYLGATMEPNGPKVRPGFPDAFMSRRYDGGIGPTFKFGGKTVYPMIPAPAAPSLVAAHGTHVTELAMGGPAFAPKLTQLLSDQSSTFMKVTVANVGDGQATMLPNSAEQLRKAVGFSGFRIVNISLEYQDNADEDVRTVFSYLFGPEQRDKLYVVAAGNEEGDAAEWYPAAFGGLARENAITVAATRADGSLAQFSNYGQNVDLAAPGCRIISTVDADHNAGPMSGTSQASPQVAFAAALLRTLGGLSPLDIKTRLIISGPLIVPPPKPEPDGRRDPSVIWSRSRLSVERALYLYDDLLELDDGTVYLGDINEIAGLSCRAPDSGLITKREAPDFYAFKHDKTGGYVFFGRGAGKLQAPCLWSGSTSASLVFKPLKKVTDKGLEDPDIDRLQPDFSQIRQLTWRTSLKPQP